MKVDVKKRRKLVPVGLQESLTKVGGHTVRYLTGGKGTPLVLLPGLMGYSFSWSENLPALAEHFQVFAPDLLNTGYSDRADVPADLISAAIRVRDFLDAVQIKSCDLLGSSYGGTIAMALTAISPERVKRMVLVAPAHSGSERERWQAAFFSNPLGSLVGQALRFVPAWFHGFFIRRMYGVPSRALSGTIDGYAAPLRLPGSTAHAVKLMHRWRSNFEQLAGLMPVIRDIPALLVWGSRDRIVPLRTSKALLAQFSGAKLSVIESAGHLPYEELPDQFNKIVLDFLRSEAQPMASGPRSL